MCLYVSWRGLSIALFALPDPCLALSQIESYYNSSNVCLFVCSLSPPRLFDGSSPNLVRACRWTSHLPLRGSFSKRSMGRRVNGSLSLSTILYTRQPHTTQLQKAALSCCEESNSSKRRLALRVNLTSMFKSSRIQYSLVA